MKKIITIAIGVIIILSLPSCKAFDVNEAAHFSHKCASKHKKRLHMYNGKLFFSNIQKPFSPDNV